MPQLNDSAKNRRMTPKQKNAKKARLVHELGFDPCCFWCRKILPLGELTLDHLIPISKGGSNNLENLRLACSECNGNRGNSSYPPEQKYKSSSLNQSSK